MRSLRGQATLAAVMVWAALAAQVPAAAAQSKVGSDSTPRLTHLGHSFLYGTVLGLGFAAVDQWQDDPPQWGRSWRGLGKRTASNLGEFYIQQGVSEGLAAAMNRPVDYQRCTCTRLGNRLWWAVQSAVIDPLPNGRRAVAVPRIVGAYTGSVAQAAWRPPGNTSRFTTAVVNGSTSLAIGALLNLYHEFRPHGRTATVAGERKN